LEVCSFRLAGQPPGAENPGNQSRKRFSMTDRTLGECIGDVAPTDEQWYTLSAVDIGVSIQINYGANFCCRAAAENIFS